MPDVHPSAVVHEGVDLSDTVHLGVDGTVKLDGGIGALVRPGKDIELLTGFGPGTPSAASGTVGLALVTTLERTLGNRVDAQTKAAWIELWSLICTVMIPAHVQQAQAMSVEV